LGVSPVYQLDLTAGILNLDTLLGFTQGDQEDSHTPPIANGKPVIANLEQDSSASPLNGFNGQLNLTAQRIIYHGLNITDFKTQADNRHGPLALNTLSGKLGEGEFNLPGSLDTTGKKPHFELQPSLKRIALGPLLQALALPQTLDGLLSVEGQLTGQSFTVADFAQHWHGVGDMRLDNARLEGLNIQQLIQRAVERSSNNVTAERNDQTYSVVKVLRAQATLERGTLRLDNLTGESDLMTLNGTGALDLPGRQCDVNLSIRVLKGWQGEPQITEALATTDIPLRVYGPWDNLSYELHVDQVLRDRLQDELKKRLDAWAQKNQQNPQNKGLQKLMEKL
jgi:AsmA protein